MIRRVGGLQQTLVQSGDKRDDILLRVSRDVFHAIAAAVEIAYEDQTAVPREYRDQAEELLIFCRVNDG